MSFCKLGRQIRWPDHVWQKKLEQARQMVADVRAHINGLEGQNDTAEKQPQIYEQKNNSSDANSNGCPSGASQE